MDTRKILTMQRSVTVVRDVLLATWSIATVAFWLILIADLIR